jgi:hypothetical protein
VQGASWAPFYLSKDATEDAADNSASGASHE